MSRRRKTLDTECSSDHIHILNVKAVPRDGFSHLLSDLYYTAPVLYCLMVFCNSLRFCDIMDTVLYP